MRISILLFGLKIEYFVPVYSISSRLFLIDRLLSYVQLGLALAAKLKCFSSCAIYVGIIHHTAVFITLVLIALLKL